MVAGQEGRQVAEPIRGVEPQAVAEQGDQAGRVGRCDRDVAEPDRPDAARLEARRRRVDGGGDLHRVAADLGDLQQLADAWPCVALDAGAHAHAAKAAGEILEVLVGPGLQPHRGEGGMVRPVEGEVVVVQPNAEIGRRAAMLDLAEPEDAGVVVQRLVQRGGREIDIGQPEHARHAARPAVAAPRRRRVGASSPPSLAHDAVAQDANLIDLQLYHVAGT